MVKSLVKIIKLLRDKELVIIYNMGKVGSSSLVKSIPKAIQIHTLYKDLPPRVTRKKNMTYKRYFTFFLARLVSLYTIKSRKKTKIITVVRDPMKRNRSMFFQDIELWLTKYNLEMGGDKSEYYMDPLIDAYRSGFDHSFYYNWFIDELQRLTKIDITRINFNGDSIILKNRKYEILILKMENMKNSELIISEFLNQQIEMSILNISSKKWYGNIYNEFKKLPIMDCEKKIYEHEVVMKLGYKI